MKLTALLLAASLSVFAAACSSDASPPSPTAIPAVSNGLPTAASHPTEPPATATSQPTEPPATSVPDTNPATPPAAGSTNSFAFPASPDSAAKPALLVDVRVGAHPENGGFDRIVFEFANGQRPSGLVSYKTNLIQCGSGFPVDPPGSHTLSVHFDFTNAHTDSGALSIPSTTVSGPGNSILNSESTCDFEAVVEWAIGVDGEQPFTVTLLKNPNRVVIDVAH